MLTLAIAAGWSVPLGVVSAVRQNTCSIRGAVFSSVGSACHLFRVLILYFLVRLFGWMPPLEYIALTEDPVHNLKQLIWPALAQAYYISAPIMRLTRSQMLEVVRQDYVRTARAKGLGEGGVIYRHALRNALLPVVTFIGGGEGGCGPDRDKGHLAVRVGLATCRRWLPRLRRAGDHLMMALSSRRQPVRRSLTRGSPRIR